MDRAQASGWLDEDEGGDGEEATERWAWVNQAWNWGVGDEGWRSALRSWPFVNCEAWPCSWDPAGATGCREVCVLAGVEDIWVGLSGMR